MSKQDKIAKLKEYIKNYVIKELEKDEDIEEASTTASAGAYHYDTPYAFYGGRKKDKEKKKKISHAGGYKPVNEKLSVDPRKVYGGTGAKQGMVLTAQKGLKKILDLSKKNPSNVFLVSDDNYTNFGPYYVKNGKVAKYTVANPNYDLQKNKVSRLKVPSDVILKFTINEGRYHEYRNDESLTPKQKIGRSMREIRDALNELDKTVKMNLKLKTELNMKSEDYWKNTHKALTKISERLVKMANKVGNLK
jgi:hypothetical protein